MKQRPLVKITPPSHSGAVPRERLFGLLDRGLTRPVIWISAPAGSGKTTLLSSYVREREIPCLWYRCDEGDADLSSFFYYLSLAALKANPRRKKPLPLLTPEYLLGVPTFTRRYFEKLSERLARPCLLVLDNYQSVPSDAQIHEMLVHGLEAVPPGISLAIASRCDPPPVFARMQANDKLGLIGRDDLRFTVKETAAVLAADGGAGRTRKTAEKLHAKSGGWIAAIMLLLESARLRGGETDFSGECDSQKVFDYFAGEIFSRTTPETRVFLLTTSVLGTVSATLARELSGRGDADRVLSDLSRQNYFTERLSGGGQDYQYHPLFREFLLEEAARSFGREKLRTLRASAGALLEAAGRDDEAVEQYAGAEAHDSLARLILSRAEQLVQQGRQGTLHQWLSLLPAAVIDADPRLLYLRGVSLLGRDLRECGLFMEKAFHAFNAAGDAGGALRAWAGAVEALTLLNDRYGDLDPWIEWLDNRMAGSIRFPAPELEALVAPQMVIALAARRPDHPRMSLWETRLEALMRNEAFDAPHRIAFANYLMGCRFIPGFHRRAAAVLREMRPLVSEKKTPPFLFLKWQFAEASYAAYTGAPDDCAMHLDRALKVSGRNGINVLNGLLLYIGAQGSVLRRSSGAVAAFLEKLDSLPHLPANIQAEYHMASAAKALLDNDDHAAAEHFGIAAGIYERTGNRVYAAVACAYAALVWSAAGSAEKAAGALGQARRQNAAGLPASGAALFMAEAYEAFRAGREQEGLSRTASFLALGREHGTNPFPYCPPRPLAALCARALAAGIETDWARVIIRTHRLAPEEPIGGPERWPWRFRICTLGGFRIIRDDAPMAFSGKTPQKPLELLKALIAFGGSNVPEDRLTDALWPDADGDLAHKSLETTLGRLRRLLGDDEAVQHRAGELSLDPRRCWVDSISLERIIDGAAGSRECLQRALREAVALYKGQFLPVDEDRDWVAARSERLKDRLLRLIMETGRFLEQDGLWEEAIDCYRKGLETDFLAEELYRRLLICFHRLGRRSEAVRLYSRCKELLLTHLAVEPSAETEAIYSSILKS